MIDRIPMRDLPVLVVMLSAMSTLMGSIAVAQSALPDQPDNPDDRYILQRAGDGVFRVDRETGEASLCEPRNVGWVCELIPDDREALEDEIARLARQNADLKSRLVELEGRLTGDVPEEEANEESTLDLPTEEEIDEMMAMFEDMMRRFFDMAQDLQRDFTERERAE